MSTFFYLRPSKFTQIGIFGLKINPLATLLQLSGSGTKALFVLNDPNL
jgi:hypothetical protein